MLLLSCTTSPDAPIRLPPAITIERTNPALQQLNGVWLFRQKPFNGYIIEKDRHRIIARLPVVDGREEGVALGWYANGRKKYERSFRRGNREGVHRGWYPNGQLAFLYWFDDDKYEGEQKTFFESGHRWQSLQYVHGYEEGKQKTWNDSGRVVNNFTVKNGKLYGVIGRYDCMSIYQK
ncbi:toxin-antitoxin system YwqK family antitoxin [Spirosoma gilvum]